MEEDPSTKEAYRIFYLTKGHLDVTVSVAKDCYHGYFNRLWGVVENTVELEEEFEIAYAEKFGKEGKTWNESIVVEVPAKPDTLLEKKLNILQPMD